MFRRVENSEFDRNYELKKLEGLILMIKTILNDPGSEGIRGMTVNKCSDPLLFRFQLSIEIKCNLMFLSVKIIVENSSIESTS